MELISVGQISDEVSMTRLLTEVYSKVEIKIADPKEYFKTWTDRLQTINEDNVEE